VEEFLLTLHILAAGTWIGANVVQFVVTPRVGGAGAEVAAHWHRTAVSLGLKLYTSAAILLVITGFGLVGVSDGLYEMSDPFVSLGFLTVIVGAALSMRVFAPLGRRIADTYERGGDTGPLERRRATLAGVDTLLVVVTVAAMVAKWGA